jgi:hypothetical protein
MYFNLTTICTYYTADAHTDNDITDILNENNVIAEDNMIVVNGLDMIRYNSVDTADITLDYSDTSKIMFTYDFEPLPGGNQGQQIPQDQQSGIGSLTAYEFSVQGNYNVEYIQNDAHKAWFIIDGLYWIDFDTEADANYDIVKLSGTHYLVTITSSDTAISFNSLGIINTNTQSQTITAEYPVPSSMSGFLMCDPSIYTGIFTTIVILCVLFGIMISYARSETSDSITKVLLTIATLLFGVAMIMMIVIGC